MSILAAILLASSPTPALAPTITTAGKPIFGPEPTMSLSAIRRIQCEEGTGSGFIIADDILVTALHVATIGGCKDAETGVGLLTYHEDQVNDFALMSGDLPEVIPFKYSCAGFRTGETYYSYGITPWSFKSPVFGQYKVTALDQYTDSSFVVGRKKTPMPGMRYLDGYIVPGNSGGPVSDLNGFAVGINNVSGRAFFGLGVKTDGYSYELRNTILCNKG